MFNTLIMNIIEFFKTFETNEQAVEYLEKVRWPGKTICPYCKGETTCCHKGNDRKIRRWQCWGCKRSFSVTVGTVFHRTHVALRDWFLILALMIMPRSRSVLTKFPATLDCAKGPPGASSRESVQPWLWTRSRRLSHHGIVEADETYIGGKPRKRNRVKHREPGKRIRPRDRENSRHWRS